MTTSASQRIKRMKEALLAAATLFLGPYYVIKEWLTWLHEARRYYGNRSFRSCDLQLLRRLGLRPPSWVILNAGRTRQAYGETPLDNYEWLLRTIPNAINLKWIEAGCGRGRGVFWLATHLNPETKIEQQVTGVELSIQFFQACRAVQLKQKMTACHFIFSDFCQLDYRPYDVVFLYGTCIGDQQLVELALGLLRLKPGSWVASVSFPIDNYAVDGAFETFAKRKVQMIWGDATLYLSRRTALYPLEGSAQG